MSSINIGKQRGFNLVELLVVVTIVGIISSVALPSYQKSVLKSKRSDGKALLLNITARMEKTMFTNGSYTSDLTTVGFATASAVFSPEEHYKASVVAPTLACPIATCYVVLATPQGGQSKDGIMQITSTGIKSRDKNYNGNVTDTDEDSW